MFFKFGQNKKGSVRPHTSAVVAAGGQGLRMGAGSGKLFIPLLGVPLIVHTLAAFEECPLIDEVVISAREEDIVPLSELCREFELGKVWKIVRGGQNRTQSVYAGLCELSRHTRFVAVHDGARPLVSANLIERTLQKAYESGAAAPCVALKDCLKETGSGKIVKTVDKARVSAVQTPQAFDVSVIKPAIYKMICEGISLYDDCGALEAIGMPVSIVEGDLKNIKVTTPEDIAVAEAFLLQREEAK